MYDSNRFIINICQSKVMEILEVCVKLSTAKLNPALRTPANTDTSLLRTVPFVPGERKPLHFL